MKSFSRGMLLPLRWYWATVFVNLDNVGKFSVILLRVFWLFTNTEFLVAGIFDPGFKLCLVLDLTLPNCFFKHYFKRGDGSRLSWWKLGWFLDVTEILSSEFLPVSCRKDCCLTEGFCECSLFLDSSSDPMLSPTSLLKRPFFLNPV